MDLGGKRQSSVWSSLVLHRGRPLTAVLRLALAYLVLVEIALQAVFGRVAIIHVGFGEGPVPRGVLLQGAVLGLLYGLVSFGIILVYRANRIINFAGAALGASAAVGGMVLSLGKGVPFLLALPLALAAAALVGAAIEIVVIRRFERSSRLVLSVATIGLGLLLSVVEFYVPRWLTGNVLQRIDVASPFRSFSFTVGIVRLTGDSIFAAFVVLVALVALGAFFRFTDVGVAVRAAAENADRARLLGVPVSRLGTIVWSIAAVLSALAIFLRGSLVGLPVGSSVGPSVLLFGLAAAVVARMESFPIALVAGMGLGVLEQTAQFATRTSAGVWLVVLIVVLAALLGQRSKFTRTSDAGVSTFQSVEDARPLPLELRSVPEVIWSRRLVVLGGLLVALGAPYFVGGANEGLETRVVLYAMIGVSVVLLTGWAGQISLGQFAIAGIGAATTAAMAVKLEADFFLSLLVAGVVGSIVAVLVGLPALRIKGMFLAVTTLAFAFVVEAVVLNDRYFGWLLLDEGEFIERPRLYGLWSVTSETRFYYVCLVFLLLSMAFARALRKNRGRALIGLRDNEPVTQALGLRPATTRIAIFAISGFIAAVAGGLLAYSRGIVTSTGFNAFESINVFAMVVVGGVASVGGAVLGAIFMLGLPLMPVLNRMERITELTSAAGLLFVLHALPGGLAEVTFRVRLGFLRWVADRRQIRVPSLFSDTLEDSALPSRDVGPPVKAHTATTSAAAEDPPGSLPYQRYVAIEGWCLVAIGAAVGVAAWPGVLLDHDARLAAAFAVAITSIVLAAQVAGTARRGASPWRPGEWFVSRAVPRASVYRPVSAAAEVRRVLFGQTMRAAALGVGWMAMAARFHFDNELAWPGPQLGVGVALVVVGALVVLDGPRVVAANERRHGARYGIGGRGRGVVIGRVPRLTLLGETADGIRAAERSSGAVLSCRGVEVAYDHVQVLFGCDLAVYPGEIVALLGTNGAGKSTLLRAIAGLTPACGGAILFAGDDIAEDDPVEIASRGVAQVPGGRAIFPTLTVTEHLRLAGWLHRHDQPHLTQARADVFELFPRLRERADQRAGDLSGGEQQMLGMAMALVAKPNILMIDELSLGLAPSVVEQLMGVVRGIAASGTAVVLVEQSLNVAVTLAERAYFLEKGQVRFSGACRELLERQDLARAIFLPSAPKPNGQNQPKRRVDDRPSILSCSELRRSFGGVVAVDGTTFAVQRGEVVGLIGANGAGKTTILDLVSGYLRPDSGTVVFDGAEVTALPLDARSRLGLGRSFQDARLVPSLSVAENLALALERHIPYRGLLAGGCNLPAIARCEVDVAWTVADLIELMNLEDNRDKLVRELSTGTRRVIDLAMALAHDPKLLLLDEPAAGIAQREVEAMAALLLRVRDELGCAMLVVEHDMPMITSISDRLIALDLGVPIAEGLPSDVIQNARVVQAYLGGDPAAIARSDVSSVPPRRSNGDTVAAPELKEAR